MNVYESLLYLTNAYLCSIAWIHVVWVSRGCFVVGGVNGGRTDGGRVKNAGGRTDTLEIKSIGR